MRAKYCFHQKKPKRRNLAGFTLKELQKVYFRKKDKDREKKSEIQKEMMRKLVDM